MVKSSVVWSIARRPAGAISRSFPKGQLEGGLHIIWVLSLSCKDYEDKKEVQQMFLDFVDEDRESIRRRRDGLYASYLIGPKERRVKVSLVQYRPILRTMLMYCDKYSCYYLTYVRNLIVETATFSATTNGRGSKRSSLTTRVPRSLSSVPACQCFPT